MSTRTLRGKIKIAAKDHAGNISGYEDDRYGQQRHHGIIVEDHAPEIHFPVNGE